jgi:hypothetical protein
MSDVGAPEEGGSVARRVAASLRSRGYYRVLKRLHAELRPATYLEIGIRKGDSLALASGSDACIGVDPQPLLSRPLSASCRVFEETSDDFFAGHDVRDVLGGREVDLAFIDGMHLFEFVLRDLANVERYAAPGTLAILHDCLPVDAVSASRRRTTRLWTGDVWKCVFVLLEHRPDLTLTVIDVGPSGLLMVEGLDPANRVLSERAAAIQEKFEPLEYEYFARDRARVDGLAGTVDDVVARVRAARGRRTR